MNRTHADSVAATCLISPARVSSLTVGRAIDEVAGPGQRERPLGDLDSPVGDCRRRGYLGNRSDPAEIAAAEDETLAAKKKALVLALRKELKTFPAWQREALALMVAGKSCRQAAAAFHCSKSRINEAVRRAIPILAVRLEQFRSDFEEVWGSTR
jgi:DNA-directed RNA polymerase specialized sigma24 family protein